LKGYIEGHSISDLPPTKTKGCKLYNENLNLDDSQSMQGSLGSPIRKQNASIDLSRSSFS